VVGFHYGAANHSELKSLRRKSLTIMGVGGVVLTLAAFVLSAPLARLFVGYDAALMQMTRNGFRLFALSFLFMGLNMFGSSFFTALNNGLVSAILSFVRTFFLQVVCILLLPLWLDLNGVWLSIVVAELLSLGMTLAFLSANQKRYHY
jgi:Na+-driven multidrug efflux pump